MKSKYFISCDWGTTNFRLRVIETETLSILEERTSNLGIRDLYESFKTSSTVTQVDFFSEHLKEEILKLSQKYQNEIIVIAGMASSNIGMKNLPYADFPFHVNGSNLNAENLETSNGLKIILISGVKNNSGMMRGEEIQAIGLSEYLAYVEKGILLLPGTHSKHISFSNQFFTDLKNFMTGELFEVIANNSILANSVIKSPWNSERKQAFKNGVSVGIKNELASNLFSVRVNDVLENKNKKDNYYYLSGMLIGDELRYLQNTDTKIFLAASNPIFEMYRTALETIIPENQLVLLDDLALKNALLIGQKKILTLHDTK
ncbi:2-dehydro-3-deoxygalactonokinase [uncultured Tenacibaculum sp.]|uniref:2-dehydro-3-deoxygalactonokinase n=1 Tax=uncultured Tenacibaculum sp. TaxID=174713 RepID=UPI002620FEBE|nr:2-dehydro-3-deoxygalactonokinase [uncultured Tenacibaculum sp.]